MTVAPKSWRIKRGLLGPTWALQKFVWLQKLIGRQFKCSLRKRNILPRVCCVLFPHIANKLTEERRWCLSFGECGLSLIVLGVNINIPQYYYEPKQHISGSVLRNYIGVGNSPVSYSSWCWARWKSPEALGMESARSAAWISLVYMLTVPVAS